MDNFDEVWRGIQYFIQLCDTKKKGVKIDMTHEEFIYFAGIYPDNESPERACQEDIMNVGERADMDVELIADCDERDNFIDQCQLSRIADLLLYGEVDATVLGCIISHHQYPDKEVEL